MSGENLVQVFAANPITTNNATDLMYFVRSGTLDVGMHYSDFAAQFPGKTGTGASGTWGINISGNAATATSATSASSVPVGGITGLGTGVATALAINVGSAGAFVTFNGAGGTPSSMTATNLTGTAAGLTAGNATTAAAVAVGGITGLGTGVATALAINVGSAGAFVTFNGAGGTPSSMTATNLTGTAAGLTAGNATTAAAVAVGGITGLGTGVATALAVNTGSAGAFVVLGGALGTPSSGTLTNATGYTIANLSDGAWTDFSGTAGATGFSGTPTFNTCIYKKIGRTVFCEIYVSGTSNATSFTITGLPFTSATSGNFIPTTLGNDNGLNVGVQGSISGTTLTLYNGVNATVWTAAGTKGYSGRFFYESTT